MLNISIGWEYFLGIMGSLILIAWYTNGRFVALETSMEWVKKAIDELGKAIKKEEEWVKKSLDELRKAIEKDEVVSAGSPQRLNERGIKILNESGVKGFVDEKKDELLSKVREMTFTNPYDAEKRILEIMQEVPQLYPEVVESTKNGAFRAGADVDTVLLVGGFYLRDLIFPDLGFSLDDIDNHK